MIRIEIQYSCVSIALNVRCVCIAPRNIDRDPFVESRPFIPPRIYRSYHIERIGSVRLIR